MRWRFIAHPLTNNSKNESCQSIPVRSRGHAAAMKHAQIVDALKDPSCPECGCMMWIQTLEPGEPGHDKRTFGCPRCQHVEVFEVQSGPAEPAIAETG